MNARLAAQVTCILPAPPEVVYDEWVDVEAFRQWMCPLPARPLAIDIDPPSWRSAPHRHPGTGASLLCSWQVLSAGPAETDQLHLELLHLAQSDTFTRPFHAGAADESVVDVRFEPHGQAETRMTMTHSLLPPELVAQHEAGWQQIARQLQKEVERHAHLSDGALPGKAGGG